MSLTINKVVKIALEQFFDRVLIQNPSGMKVEALPEPLSAGMVYPVSSSRPQQGEKAVIWVVEILNNTPNLSLTQPGVDVLYAG